MLNPSLTPIMIGLSGGVDSSVAAWLLLEQNYAVEAMFMKNWDEDDGSEYCTAQQDLEDACAVADKLGIRLHTCNFASEYWDHVFEYFLREYQQLRTPNPDILCNREIKFKAFLDYARQLGAQKIATGHYARLSQTADGHMQLLKGVDANKDQSYFLHALNQDQLSQSLFPLGNYHKKEVRALAKKLGFGNHAKKDSTGICFIGERRFRDFLQRYLPNQPGPIVTTGNQVIGEHSGLMYYTLGQRQGLAIGGIKNHSEAPWYVAAKNIQDNALVVVQGEDHPSLLASGLIASLPHWLENFPLPLNCHAKIRHRQPDQACYVSSDTPGQLKVQFKQPQRGVNPGQFIVFYENELCLGGATIDGAI
jgi:tRNA-specific 2-thiouridylase